MRMEWQLAPLKLSAHGKESLRHEDAKREEPSAPSRVGRHFRGCPLITSRLTGTERDHDTGVYHEDLRGTRRIHSRTSLPHALRE
jgi:hypothetical protein